MSIQIPKWIAINIKEYDMSIDPNGHIKA